MKTPELSKSFFPHLLPIETEVWREFLAKWGDTWDRFEYDIHVGKGVQVGEKGVNKYADNFATLTQKRIDAIGWNKKFPTLFEIREVGNLELIGKIEGYSILWEKMFPMENTPDLAIVCRRMGPDDLTVAAHKKIHVYITHEQD